MVANRLRVTSLYVFFTVVEVWNHNLCVSRDFVALTETEFGLFKFGLVQIIMIENTLFFVKRYSITVMSA